MSFFSALFGIGPRASEPSFDISEPFESKLVTGSKLDVLATDVLKLSKILPSELEAKYSDFLELKKRRAKDFPQFEEDWEIVQAEPEKIALIDDVLSGMQIRLSETNAHKEHVLQKLESLRDAILSHTSEEGIFRLSGGASAIASLAERLEMDPKADLSKESRDTFVSVFKKIVKEFGGEHSSVLIGIQDELLSEDTSKAEELKKIVKKLKTNSPEYKITKLVIGLLSDVAIHSDTNKMSSSNLAMCMSQNLFSIANPMEALNTTPIVKGMIENYTTIFE